MCPAVIYSTKTFKCDVTCTNLTCDAERLYDSVRCKLVTGYFRYSSQFVPYLTTHYYFSYPRRLSINTEMSSIIHTYHMPFSKIFSLYLSQIIHNLHKTVTTLVTSLPRLFIHNLRLSYRIHNQTSGYHPSIIYDHTSQLSSLHNPSSHFNDHSYSIHSHNSRLSSLQRPQSYLTFIILASSRSNSRLSSLYNQ
jgi:hypothetical protein